MSNQFFEDDDDMTESLKYLREALLKSHWPKCCEIAEKIVEIGGSEAKEILIDALKSKRHHIRSAAIKCLVKLGDVTVIKYLELHFNDKAYETRLDAKEAVEKLKNLDIQ